MDQHRDLVRGDGCHWVQSIKKRVCNEQPPAASPGKQMSRQPPKERDSGGGGDARAGFHPTPRRVKPSGPSGAEDFFAGKMHAEPPPALVEARCGPGDMVGRDSVAALVPHLSAEFRRPQDGNLQPSFSRAAWAAIERKYGKPSAVAGSGEADDSESEGGGRGDTAGDTAGSLVPAPPPPGGCVVLPLWAAEEGGLPELFRRLPAVMRNRTLVFIGDAFSDDLAEDVSHASVALHHSCPPRLVSYPCNNAPPIASSAISTTRLAAGLGRRDVLEPRPSAPRDASGRAVRAVATRVLHALQPARRAARRGASREAARRAPQLASRPPRYVVLSSSSSSSSYFSSSSRAAMCAPRNPTSSSPPPPPALAGSQGTALPLDCASITALDPKTASAYALPEVAACLGHLLGLRDDVWRDAPNDGWSGPGTILVASSGGFAAPLGNLSSDSGSGGDSGGGGGSGSGGTSSGYVDSGGAAELLAWHAALPRLRRPLLIWREALPHHYAKPVRRASSECRCSGPCRPCT